MRIGVLGGTFDPIHLAHLVMAEEVREQADLARILFVPAGSPPHKSPQGILAGRHRLAMVRLALEGNPRFEARAIELERQGRSYTLDTMETLGREFGPGAEMFLIVGADQVIELENWKEPRTLLDACTLLICPRPGFALEALPAWVAGRARIMSTTRLEISSSQVRDRLRRGRSARYLVPHPVLRYIEEHGLYRA